MKRRIRLTEGDLHRIVEESVRRILREHDPDDPDYGQYGDAYDAAHYLENCESECGVLYWFNPKNGQMIIDGEADENDDSLVELYIYPEFDGGDEYGFNVGGFRWEFDTGDEKFNAVLEKHFSGLVDDFINKNSDEIYEFIKKNSPYRIY